VAKTEIPANLQTAKVPETVVPAEEALAQATAKSRAPTLSALSS